MDGAPDVRQHRAPFRIRLRDEIAAVAPLEPGEGLLIDQRIMHGGEWVPHAGWLRVTDRRVFVLVGRWLGRNEVIEIPGSLVRVRPAPVFDPVIRLEVNANVDDDALAFRAWDWFPPPTGRGIALRIRQESIRTTRLRERLLLLLGSSDGAAAHR